jgi:hypothetical protein
MSERERWVIYPLLFLALGAALRDKLVDQTTTKSLICQELLVVDEQPLGGEPVLLARLGPREQASSNGEPNGQLVLNGQMLLNGEVEVVDRDPTSQQLMHRLVTIGRGRFGPKGLPGGNIVVNGVINATFYAYQGQPIIPVLRGVVPGASIPAELLRAVPDALAPTAPSNVPQSAPAEKPDSEPPAAPQAPPTEQPTQSRPSTPASDEPQSPSAAPLADPAENR